MLAPVYRWAAGVERDLAAAAAAPEAEADAVVTELTTCLGRAAGLLVAAAPAAQVEALSKCQQRERKREREAGLSQWTGASEQSWGVFSLLKLDIGG